MIIVLSRLAFIFCSRHFKNKLGHQSKKDENKWRLLVAKVQSAKHGTNAFSLASVSARLEEDHE